MPKRNWLFALLALSALIAASLAVACGGDDDDDDTEPAVAPAGTVAPTATPSPTVAPKLGGSMILATTTSTQDSGLLDVLVPMFKETTGVEVKVIAVGTGAALEMGAKGDADAVLVHAPASEKKYVDAGDLVEGKLIMHNDFIIVGPASDPAKVKGLKDLNAAMQAVAAVGPFVSRGDDSGTHKAELQLWKDAGIDPKAAVKDRVETGQGMGATLNVAGQRGAYTLTDRATYLTQRKNLQLDVVFEGARPLLNIYHAYLVSPTKFPKVQAAQARAFINFLVSAEVQQVIGDFKKADFGQSLFVPDAGKRVEDLGQ
ncbi:MAG: substrate-binding domain-containing protein [Dehalococcoidia bacterium]